MATPVVVVNLRIAPELHREVTAAAYGRQTSATRWLIEAIREKLERDRNER
jgi:predicted HicB family RNase H-like nuclease